jgi:hypothetical protein
VRCKIPFCAVAVTLLSERELRASGTTVSAMLARSGATTATAAPPELLAPVMRSPRVSTRPTLGTLKFCSTPWPDHARSWGTFRTCHFSFGQASELSVSTRRGMAGGWPPSPPKRSLALVKVCLPKSQNSVSGRLVTRRLDWRRAPATRFAYGRCSRQSSEHLWRAYRGNIRHQALAGRDQRRV